MTEQPVLSVRDLRTVFTLGRDELVAVDGISFDVGRGEILGIVGESGCGKSVTASSILRLVPSGGRVASGQILFNGTDVLAMSPEELRRLRGDGAAMIFQDPMSSLNPVLRVGEQTAEAMLVHGTGKAQARARAGELLERVRIPGGRNRLADYPHQFSGGMRQRIMIAMGLANEPALLIADEPTTALDVTVQAQILDLLRELNRDTGTAIMMITHNMAVVAELCTRVAVMYAGRIVEEGPTAQVLANPQHPYTSMLLRALPRLDGERGKRLMSIDGMPPNLASPPPGCRFQPRCPYAVDRCAVEEPTLDIVAPGHVARCWVPMSTVSPRPAAVPEAATVPPEPPAPAGLDAPPLVRVEGVTKKFPLGSGLFGGSGTVSAVDGVSLDIRSGETLGLVGESGCGKSTLGRLLLRLEPVTGGRITFDGTDLTALRPREMRSLRQQMQMVFQDSHASLNPRWTVEEIVGEPLRNFGVRRATERRRRVAEALEVCGLSARFLSRYPHEFSGGQRQRIGIARALVLRPRLVVADEPVSALDASVQATIVNLLQDLQKQFQLTYVFISHDLSVVRHIADRVAVMYLGKVVEVGDADQIYEDPRHPYTRALLSAVPRLDAAPPADPADVPRAAGIEVPSPIDPPTGCRFHPRCPVALPLCAEKEPPLVSETPSRSVACHLVGDQA